MKLNADTLSPSLLILARCKMAKGDDTTGNPVIDLLQGGGFAVAEDMTPPKPQ